VSWRLFDHRQRQIVDCGENAQVRAHACHRKGDKSPSRCETEKRGWVRQHGSLDRRAERINGGKRHVRIDERTVYVGSEEKATDGANAAGEGRHNFRESLPKPRSRRVRSALGVGLWVGF